MAEAIEDVPDGARSETARRLDRTVDVGTSVDIVLHVALVLETTQHSANSDFLEIALPRHGLVHVFDDAGQGPDGLHHLVFELTERGTVTLARRLPRHVLHLVTVQVVTCQLVRCEAHPAN